MNLKKSFNTADKKISLASAAQRKVELTEEQIAAKEQALLAKDFNGLIPGAPILTGAQAALPSPSEQAPKQPKAIEEKSVRESVSMYRSDLHVISRIMDLSSRSGYKSNLSLAVRVAISLADGLTDEQLIEAIAKVSPPDRMASMLKGR